MKNGLNKFAKGMFAIFTIKLFLLTITYTFQSCSDEPIDPSQDVAVKAFRQALKESVNGLEKIKEKRKKETLALSRTSEDVVCGSIDTGCYTTTEVQQMKQSMTPTINAAKNFLLSRELTNADIVEILDGGDESALIPLVESVLYVEAEANNFVYNNNDYNKLIELIGVQSALAQHNEETISTIDWGIVGGCAISTLGLDSLQDLKDALAGKKVSGGALKKAAKKVIKKFVAGLTGWGTIILVAEFSICVGVGHAF